MAEKLKAYIAGPMTGREHYNVANFFRVQREWEARGYEASTPFEANSRVWHRHYGTGFNPYIDKCDYGDPILTEMLIEDLKQLFESDVVVVLDGWMKSKGAQLEVAVAAALGKQVIDNLTDLAGYTECASMVAGEQVRRAAQKVAA